MSRNRPRVLIVDDESIIRIQLARALKAVGLDCDSAENGEDALRKVAGHRYDLVVTDLRMPQCHGHSLAVTLLHQVDRPKIVALSGVTDPRLKKDLLSRGVDDFIAKPVNFFNLAERLKGMLNGGAAVASGEKIERDQNGSLTPEILESDPDYKKRAAQLRDEIESSLLSQGESDWQQLAFEWMDWNRIANPPVEIKRFLRRFCRPCPYSSPERRNEERITLNEICVCVPLDDEWKPIRPPFKLILRDLSKNSVGLVHNQNISTRRLAIMWRTRKKTRVCATLEILRCQQLAEYFDLGAKILRFPVEAMPPENAEPLCEALS